MTTNTVQQKQKNVNAKVSGKFTSVQTGNDILLPRIRSDKHLRILVKDSASAIVSLTIPAIEIYNVMASFPDSDIYWCPQKMREDTKGRRKNDVVRLRYAVLDLDFSLAKRKYDLEELLHALDKKGLPKPAYIVFSGGGYHIYWSIGSLDITKKRRVWTEFYEDVTRKLCVILKDYGADPQAIDVGHLFRVPGSRNQKRQETAQIVFTSLTETSLQNLSKAAGKVSIHQFKPNNESSPPLMKAIATPAIQWMLKNKFPEGYRNATLYALAQAYLWSRYSSEDTLNILTEWNRGHTLPMYPTQELKDIVASCARRFERNEPLGIDHRKLMQIPNIYGETLEPSIANSIYQGLPNGFRYTAKPLDQLKNRPVWEGIVQALESIERHKLLNEATNTQAAESVGVPLGTYKKLVKPLLQKVGLCHITRRKSSYISTYNIPHPQSRAQAPLINFIRWGMESGIKAARFKTAERYLRYLWKRFPTILIRLLRVLKRLGGTILRWIHDPMDILLDGIDNGWLVRQMRIGFANAPP